MGRESIFTVVLPEQARDDAGALVYFSQPQTRLQHEVGRAGLLNS